MLWTAPLSNILMARGDPISMPHFGWLLWLLVAHMRRTSSARAGPVVGPNRTFFQWPATSQFDPFQSLDAGRRLMRNRPIPVIQSVAKALTVFPIELAWRCCN